MLVVLVTTRFTVTVSEAVVAHKPVVGVNVYVVVVVLFTVPGDQLPVIPLVEVVGKTGAVAPLQIAGTALNAGITCRGATRVTCAVWMV